MDVKSTQIKNAWQSATLKRAIMAVSLISLVACVMLGGFIQYKENQLRERNLLQVARTLASSVLSAGGEEEDILLKVNDLLNVEAVEGVRLLQGTDSPLYAGTVSEDLPPAQTTENQHTQWGSDAQMLDIALRLAPELPFDWLVLRLNAQQLQQPAQLGTLINWVGAPVVSLITGLAAFFILSRGNIQSWQRLITYFETHKGRFSRQSPDSDLLKRKDEIGQVAQGVEAMRDELAVRHQMMEEQARLLQETPYALLRCSVNRKVLFANPAAKSESTLFGDETREFVSPALSELVRKAFYEAKQVYGDVRCPNYAITFRAIPILEAGYVNLYGERIKRHEDMF